MSAPACRVCSRKLEPGEDAWAEDWHVLTADGWRIAERYVCDGCAA